jgi:type IV pilus assembly protein PilP
MSAQRMKALAPLAALACSALLAGCGDGGVGEVREWMAQVQRETHPSVKPLPEPKDFLPYAYAAKDAVDPFSPAKLMTELAKVAAESTDPNKPDTARPRELLESFPLDTMRMVGLIQKAGVNYALLQIDRSVYQVRAGQHIGQNFGVITHVGEDAVTIREVVQDAAGEWTQRMAKLELQNKETGK